MSFDCQFKVQDGFCRRINRQCNPGEKGCILYGRFTFPFRDEKKEEESEEVRKPLNGKKDLS